MNILRGDSTYFFLGQPLLVWYDNISFSVASSVYVQVTKLVWFGQVTTPLVFKAIPAVVHLGILLKWFSPDSSIEVCN